MALILNDELAKSADKLNGFITQSGKYIGTITRAQKMIGRSNGTLSLGLSFKADIGLTAEYLNIYYESGDGRRLSGMADVNAIFKCANVNTLREGKIKFDAWDKIARKRLEFEKDGFPDLMYKRIGLLLQKELFTDYNNTDKERMIIVGIFQADTEFTASEIIDKKTKPEILEKMLANLASKPIKNSRLNKTTTESLNSFSEPNNDYSEKSYGNNFSELEDDIPF